MATAHDEGRLFTHGLTRYIRLVIALPLLTTVVLVSGLGLSSSALVIVILSSFLATIPTHGLSVLAGLLVLHMQVTAITGVFAVPFGTYPILGAGLIVGIAFKVPQLRPPSGLVLLASIGTTLFVTLAWFRLTSDSFVFYLPDGSQSRDRNLIYLAFELLIVALAMLYLPTPSRTAFLITISSAGAIMAIILAAEGALNSIWIARSAGLAILAALCLERRPRLRLILIVGATFAFAYTIAAKPGVDAGTGDELTGLKDGPTLAVVVGLLIYLFQRFRHWSIVALFPVLAVLLMSTQFYGVFAAFANRDQNATGRLALWSDAWRLEGISPLIGNGFGTATASTGTYPHNSALEVLYGLGVLGVVVWGFVVVLYFIGSARSTLLPLFSAAILMSALSGNIATNPEYWMVGAFSVAFVAWDSHGSDPRRWSRPSGRKGTLADPNAVDCSPNRVGRPSAGGRASYV